jgi:hypothetical protein
MAVDIEPICQGHFDANRNCVDNSGNDDWEDLPQDLNSIAGRLQRIYDAVQAVESAGLKSRDLLQSERLDGNRWWNDTRQHGSAFWVYPAVESTV